MVLSLDRLTKKASSRTPHKHLTGTNKYKISMEHSDQESKTYVNRVTENSVPSGLPLPSLISQLHEKNTNKNVTNYVWIQGLLAFVFKVLFCV